MGNNVSEQEKSEVVGKMFKPGIFGPKMEHFVVKFPYVSGRPLGLEMSDRNKGRLTVVSVHPEGLASGYIKPNDRVKAINGLQVGRELTVYTPLHPLLNKSSTVTMFIERPVVQTEQITKTPYNKATVSSKTYDWNELGDESDDATQDSDLESGIEDNEERWDRLSLSSLLASEYSDTSEESNATSISQVSNATSANQQSRATSISLASNAPSQASQVSQRSRKASTNPAMNKPSKEEGRIFLTPYGEKMQDIVIRFPYIKGRIFGIEMSDRNPGRLTVKNVHLGGMARGHIIPNDRIKSINGLQVGRELSIDTNMLPLISREPMVTMAIERPLVQEQTNAKLYNKATIYSMTYEWDDLGPENSEESGTDSEDD